METEQEVIVDLNTDKEEIAYEKKSLGESIKNLLFLLPAYLALILFVFIPIGYSLLLSFYVNPNPLQLRFAFDYYTLDGMLASLLSALVILILFFILHRVFNNKIFIPKFGPSYRRSTKTKVFLLIGEIGFFIVIGSILFIYLQMLLTPVMHQFGEMLDLYSDAVQPGDLSIVSLYNFFYQDTFFEKGLFRIEGITNLIIVILAFGYSRIFYNKIKILKRFKNKLIRSGISYLIGLVAAPLTLYLLELIITLLSPFTAAIPLPLEEFRDVLTSPSLDFMKILFNTFFWTLTCTLIHVILGIGLAILLNRKFYGRGIFRSLFILPWAIPSFVSTLMWRAYVFDRERGVLGTLWDQFGESITFSIGDLVGLVLAIVISILIVKYINRFLNKKVRISPTFRPLVSFGLTILAAVLIILLDDLLNPFFDHIFGYNIVDIPDINSTFWYTDDVYIFGYRMKMITFSAIIVNVWLGVPFMMLSFLATLQSIPLELYEAAEIDGLTRWEQFKKITLPLLKPTLLTVSLLGIIWTFNLFNVVYLLSQNQTGLGDAIYYDIFVTFIYERFNEYNDYSAASALSFTVFIILISFSLIYRRLIRVEKFWEGE